MQNNDSGATVRILPMSETDSVIGDKSCEEVQLDFFLGKILKKEVPGEYDYHEQGLNAPAGTLVLFQYKIHVIAEAILVRIDKANKKFYFDPSSIRVFDPVDADRIKGCWPEFEKFSNVKWDLTPAYYSKFEKQLTNIRTAQA